LAAQEVFVRQIHRIKYERTRLGVSQETVGVVTRLPQPTISAIERGRVVPTAAELQRFADALGVPPGALLKPVEIVELP
jgi:transcriptional regulator with XRE-family HTH domain